MNLGVLGTEVCLPNFLNFSLKKTIDMSLHRSLVILMCAKVQPLQTKNLIMFFKSILRKNRFNQILQNQYKW
jgi:hypothetical protein